VSAAVRVSRAASTDDLVVSPLSRTCGDSPPTWRGAPPVRWSQHL